MTKTAEQVRIKTKTVVASSIRAMVDRFLELNGTTFIQLWQTTKSISGMRKTNNRFHGKVKKVNCLNAVTNYNYENMVNKARSKEAMADLRITMENAGVPTDKIDLFLPVQKKT